MLLGVVRVTYGLDVERNPLYSFEVEARDGDNSDLFDTAIVSISVQDINDNSPVFTEVTASVYYMFIKLHCGYNYC